MGATNVVQVFTHWTHLGHREARLLAYLALVSLDDGRPPVYFGGWADAARAIGLDPEGHPRSAQENLRKTLRRLADAGALVPSGKAHAGRRAEYALTLDPSRTVAATGTARGPRGHSVTTWTVLDRATGKRVNPGRRLWESPSEMVAQSPTGAEGHKPHRIGGKSPTGSEGPRNYEDPHQEHREENIALEVSTGQCLDRLERSASILGTLPDGGRTALAAVDASHGPLPELDRVILAAELATAEGVA